MDINAVIIVVLLVGMLMMVGSLSILVYNQLLLLNEVNKRLLGLTIESITYARESYEDALARIESYTDDKPEKPSVEVDESDDAFDPHSFVLKDEDEVS